MAYDKISIAQQLNMDGPSHGKDLDDCLDILGQQPGLNRLYTQICICFSVTDTSSYSVITGTLTTGLERLLASFPWLAGQVVNEGLGKGNSGIFRIKQWDKSPPLIVKDRRHDPSIPTMDALRQANFPFSMLDESIIAPRKTLPGSPDEPLSDPAPVFLLQATFITGGLLLTFVGNHQTMDMTGQGQVIDLFAKACHNEQFTDEELSCGNLARRNLIPFLDDSYEQGSELAHQIAKPTPSSSTLSAANDQLAPSSTPECTWAYFSFEPSSLTILKELATRTRTLPFGHISTDDALTAFIWQSIMCARSPRSSPTVEVTLARAVDVRRYLLIPPTYPGVVNNMTYHTYTLPRLLGEPLGDITSQLRSAIDPRTSNLGYNTRALATLLNRTQDKKNIDVTATLDLAVDIMVSSWAKLDCYKLDFNLGLGKPDSVRRPQFPPVESLIYLMPKRLDGEITVGICLRNEDMERLRVDEEFAKYGKYIG